MEESLRVIFSKDIPFSIMHVYYTKFDCMTKLYEKNGSQVKKVEALIFFGMMAWFFMVAFCYSTLFAISHLAYCWKKDVDLYCCYRYVYACRFYVLCPDMHDQRRQPDKPENGINIFLSFINRYPKKCATWCIVHCTV